jgi:hypothetical protein
MLSACLNIPSFVSHHPGRQFCPKSVNGLLGGTAKVLKSRRTVLIAADYDHDFVIEEDSTRIAVLVNLPPWDGLMTQV